MLQIKRIWWPITLIFFLAATGCGEGVLGLDGDDDTSKWENVEVSSGEAPDHITTGEGPIFGVDISLWSGPITDSEVSCWREEGVEHVIVGTQNPRLTHQQLQQAIDGGMSVDLYIYLYWSESMTAQVDEALEIAKDYPVDTIWLDVEEAPKGRSEAELTELIQEGLDACGSHKCGIYTADWWWQPHMNGSEAFSDVPLWYAYYDDNPDISTWKTTDQQFGGWELPTIKQWNEKPVCGVTGDVNTIFTEAEKPPAPTERVDQPGPPNAPTELYPDDGIHVKFESPRLLSRSEPGATDYEFEIEYFSGGTWRYYATFNRSTNAQRFSPVIDNVYYRFKVRARDADGWSPWSDWAYFEFLDASEVPDISDQPEPDTTTEPEPEPDTTTDPEPDPEEEPTTEPEPEPDTTTDPEPDPEEEPTTDPEPQPQPEGAPTGLTPADGELVPLGHVDLGCDPVDNATGYEFEIEFFSTTSDEWRPYYTYDSPDEAQRFYPSLEDVEMRFRVRAEVGGTWSVWSNWSTFVYSSAI